MSFEQTGIPSADMVREKFPTESRLKSGRCAVVECYKCIPCNPCETSCPKGAIDIGEDINDIPKLDFDRCIGCGICVYSCPGLAIMLAKVSEDGAELSLPYEFLPLPKVGQVVIAQNRAGEDVTMASVVEVWAPPKCDRTPIVRIEFDRKYLYEVRGFRTEGEE